MISSLRGRACTVLLLIATTLPLAAQKWQVQYFYDKAKSRLLISDMQFASATRGVAVGLIAGDGKPTPTSLVTSDGGAHWQTVAIEERPISLFFFNENRGWMVTEKGLWQTEEAGKSWTKLPKLPGPILRVWFATEQHGWAVGPEQNAFETEDGGKAWKRFGPTPDRETKKRSTYNWIAFGSNDVGVVAGWTEPAQAFGSRVPDWVDPMEALRRPRGTNTLLNLTTRDGGKNWGLTKKPNFGIITRFRLLPNGTGVGLMRYPESMRFPAEVYSIAWPNGETRTIYRNSKFSVSDVWLTPSGTTYIAGASVPGEVRSIVPSPVVVLTTSDMKGWKQQQVDYRAEAINTLLAGFGEDVWLATDTGMILKLAK